MRPPHDPQNRLAGPWHSMANGSASRNNVDGLESSDWGWWNKSKVEKAILRSDVALQLEPGKACNATGSSNQKQLHVSQWENKSIAGEAVRPLPVPYHWTAAAAAAAAAAATAKTKMTAANATALSAASSSSSSHQH